MADPSVSSTPDQLTSTNRGPAIKIAAGIMLGVSTMVVVMRLYQRWPWSRLLKLEDGLLLTALTSEIANVAAVVLGVQYGLGQHSSSELTTDQVHYARQALTASFSLTFLTEGLSALSSVTLLRSVDPHKRFQHFAMGLMAVIATWSLAGVARFAATSSSSADLLEKSNWIGFGVISVLIQLCMFVAAMWTVWPLQMPVANKLGCSLWLSISLPVAAVTIVRLVYIPRQTFANDFTWEDIDMVIISLVESNLAIVSAAYPSLRSFMNKVSTGFLVPETVKDSRSGSKGGSYGTKGRVSGGGGSYGLQTFGSVGTRIHRSKMREPIPSLGDQTVGQHTTTVRGPFEDGRSDKSFGSEAIMVRRSVEIDEVSNES